MQAVTDIFADIFEGIAAKTEPKIFKVLQMSILRRQSRKIYVGRVQVGGGAPVSVQSMTNTETSDPAATVDQIQRLAATGCEIIRVAVPDESAAAALPAILNASPLPVIADIHFDYKLGLKAMECGVNGVRINPGNIGDDNAVQEIAKGVITHNTTLRIGVNSGSLPSDILKKHGGVTAEGLAEAAIRHCNRFEELGCTNYKVSIKSSSVPQTVAASRTFAEQTDIPLHLGITAAGSLRTGTVKSAAGLGALLLEGIGDTIRVSLAAAPEEEVRTALRILQAVGLRSTMPEVIACPTCARAVLDVADVAARLEEELYRLHREGWHLPYNRIAVMGCPVNGPGEAREADIGIAGGHGKGLLFKHGKIVRRVEREEALQALLNEIKVDTSTTK